MRSKKSIKNQLFRATKAITTAALTVAASTVTVATSAASIAKQVATAGSKQAQSALEKGAGFVKSAAARIELRAPSRPVVIGAAAVLVAAGALTAGTMIALRTIRERRALSFPTKNGLARIYEVRDDEGHPVRLLEVDGIVQSGTYVNDGDEDETTPTYTDLVFDYLKKYDAIFSRKSTIDRICVLGCGGYDYPKHLIAHHAPTVVDAVEIDPTITALAERYFYLDRLIEEYDIEENDRLNLICNDALVHLLESGPRYGAIINDVFDGGSIPEHLTSLPFYTAVKQRLIPDGIFATNFVSPVEGPGSEFLDQQIANMKMVFDNVEVIPCDPDDPQSEDNVIVLAY